MERKGLNHFESTLKKKDGSPIHILENAVGVIDDKGDLTAIRGYLTDITEMKNLENQLRQAQKMEAIGTLVGGISHDFNHLLQGINGYAELLSMNKTPDDPDYHKITSLRKICRRAADLVQQLLVFSRKAKTKKTVIMINSEIKQAINLLGKTIPKMISIKIDLVDDLWPVYADHLQIEQAILNLGSNAADAMPGGGTITIKTVNRVLSSADHDNTSGLPSGEYIHLTVRDTGSGMEPVIIEKIFDPFFTTKKLGKGTGLGLSSVYGIIKNHSGHIKCESRVGQGTSFSIFLPAYKKKVTPSEIKEPIELKQGNETILVVDDEEAIRNFTSIAFQRLGYTFFSAEDGEQAIDIYKQHRDTIDLVILDLSMPGMGGFKCLKELVMINPELKVLIVSGYSAKTTIKDCLAAGAVDYVRKPIQLNQLLHKIRNIFDD